MHYLQVDLCVDNIWNLNQPNPNANYADQLRALMTDPTTQVISAAAQAYPESFAGATAVFLLKSFFDPHRVFYIKKNQWNTAN